jgi:hypothetical protein
MNALGSGWAALAQLSPQMHGMTRRLALAAVSGAAAFALAMYGWHASGVQGGHAERAALDLLERRVNDARSTLARLPTMREEAQLGLAFADTARRTRGEDWRAISDAAAQNGVTLHAMEPGLLQGEGAQAGRAVRIAAQASFAGLVSFLRALPSLPALVVPMGMIVKREADGLAIDATLHVFDALPSVPHEGDDASHTASHASDSSLADPFGMAGLAATDAVGTLRLLGLLREGGRGLALLHTEQGVTALSTGDNVGAERIVGIDAHGVMLASRVGTRFLTLTEGAR